MMAVIKEGNVIQTSNYDLTRAGALSMAHVIPIHHYNINELSPDVCSLQKWQSNVFLCKANVEVFSRI